MAKGKRLKKDFPFKVQKWLDAVIPLVWVSVSRLKWCKEPAPHMSNEWKQHKVCQDQGMANHTCTNAHSHDKKRSGQWTFYVRRDFGKVCHSPESATSVEHELSKSKGSSWKRLIFHLSRWKMIDMLQDVAGSQKKILSVLAVCFLFLPMSVFF